MVASDRLGRLAGPGAVDGAVRDRPGWGLAGDATDPRLGLSALTQRRPARC